MTEKNHPLLLQTPSFAKRSDPRAALRRVIEALRPRAIHERHIQVIAPDRENPWLGSCERLALAESELRVLEERESAESFVAALERYESALRRIRDPETHARIREVEAALATFNAALINRWQREIAGLHHTDELYRFQAKTLAALAIDPNAAIDPSRLPFTDHEIRIVAQHGVLEAEKRDLYARLQAYEKTMRELEALFPALVDVKNAYERPAEDDKMAAPTVDVPEHAAPGAIAEVAERDE